MRQNITNGLEAYGMDLMAGERSADFDTRASKWSSCLAKAVELFDKSVPGFTPPEKLTSRQVKRLQPILRISAQMLSYAADIRLRRPLSEEEYEMVAMFAHNAFQAGNNLAQTEPYIHCKDELIADAMNTAAMLLPEMSEIEPYNEMWLQANRKLCLTNRDKAFDAQVRFTAYANVLKRRNLGSEETLEKLQRQSRQLRKLATETQPKLH